MALQRRRAGTGLACSRKVCVVREAFPGEMTLKLRMKGLVGVHRGSDSWGNHVEAIVRVLPLVIAKGRVWSGRGHLPFSCSSLLRLCCFWPSPRRVSYFSKWVFKFPRLEVVVGEHPGRGDNVRLKREKAFRLMEELCGWRRQEERMGEGRRKRERKNKGGRERDKKEQKEGV